MEEKLNLVKKMKELESNKRNTSGKETMWRGATTKKNIKGYSDAVLTQHKKVQPILPPSSMVTDTRYAKPNLQQRPPSSSGSVSNQFTGGHPPSSVTPAKKGGYKLQSQEFGEVKDFLSSIKLDKYFEKMVDNGIEDMETILELQDEHIGQMGVPLGHKLKMMKRIKELRAEKGMSMP